MIAPQSPNPAPMVARDDEESVRLGFQARVKIESHEGEPINTPEAVWERCAAYWHSNAVRLLAEQRALGDTLDTYRKVWDRMPENDRRTILGMMRCWAPEDYKRLDHDLRLRKEGRFLGADGAKHD